MRDRLINHAIRQACEDKLGADQQPAFVLYLEIDPHQVDVNVHPAKHEDFSFRRSRLVHDFIYQGVLSVLQQQVAPTLPLENEVQVPRPLPENRVAAGRNHFAEPAVAREPAAPRFSSTESAPRPTGANYRTPNPAIKSSKGHCTVNCWILRLWSVRHTLRCRRLPWKAIVRVLGGY